MFQLYVLQNGSKWLSLLSLVNWYSAMVTLLNVSGARYVASGAGKTQVFYGKKKQVLGL